MISGFGSFQDFDLPVPQARRAAEIIRFVSCYPEMSGASLIVFDLWWRQLHVRVPGAAQARGHPSGDHGWQGALHEHVYALVLVVPDPE